MLLGSSWPPKTTLLTQFLNGWNSLSNFRPKKPKKYHEKNRKKTPKKTERYCKFRIWDWFFRFFQLQPPPPTGHHTAIIYSHKPLQSPYLARINLHKALIPSKSPHNFAKSPFSPNWPSHIPNLLILQKPQFTINSPYSLY